MHLVIWLQPTAGQQLEVEGEEGAFSSGHEAGASGSWHVCNEGNNSHKQI